MDMSPQNSTYEIKTSRTGKKIPVVDGVHLHSTYDPARESEGLIARHVSTLKKKKFILFMGLGFGYHINDAIKILKEHHGSDYKIYIIEPNNDVAKDCLRLNFINNPSVRILAGKTINDLFNDKIFIDFLLNSPGIIAHPSSFNLHSKYFKTFLQYKAENTLKAIIENLKTEEIKKFFAKYPEDMEFNDLIYKKLLKEKNNSDQFAYLLLTLEYMTRSSKTHEEKDSI